MRRSPSRCMLARTLAAITVAACAKPVPITTYVCEGGDSLLVGFAETHAELRLPPDRVVRLPAVRSASGVRYSDGRYTVHTKGDEALMEQGGELVLRSCLKAGASRPDTALTPARAMAEAEAIDRRLASVTPQENTLARERPGWDPRIVRLWSEAGAPILLTVTEPTDAGRMTGLSSYYFREGRVAFVRGPLNRYVFRDTVLVFWVDDSLRALADVPPRDLEARQQFLLAEVRQYLAMFGVETPAATSVTP